MVSGDVNQPLQRKSPILMQYKYVVIEFYGVSWAMCCQIQISIPTAELELESVSGNVDEPYTLNAHVIHCNLCYMNVPFGLF